MGSREPGLGFLPQMKQNAHGPLYRDLSFSGSSALLGALLVDGDPKEALGPGVSYRLTY